MDNPISPDIWELVKELGKIPPSKNYQNAGILMHPDIWKRMNSMTIQFLSISIGRSLIGISFFTIHFGAYYASLLELSWDELFGFEFDILWVKFISQYRDINSIKDEEECMIS